MSTDRFMQDNKHYRAGKINGFWDFVQRDPGDYVGRHVLKSDAAHQLWMGCSLCVSSLK